MTSRSTLYGIAVVAVAAILLSASFSAYYYWRYETESANESLLAKELNSANSSYSQLASNFTALEAKYNESISLLASTLAVVNTSEPAYRQASSELSGLWEAYQNLRPVSAFLLRDNVLFEFGNGTLRWYNDSAIEADWSLYIQTVVLMNGRISAQWYPQYGEHLISGVGGINGTLTSSWFLWTYDRTASWKLAAVGADLVPANAGSTYAWTFCPVDKNFNPTCIP